jgi:hypothetical protein
MQGITGFALVEDHLAGPMAMGSHRDRHVRQVDGVDALKNRRNEARTWIVGRRAITA